MSTNLDEVIEQHKITIHELDLKNKALEKEIEHQLDSATTPEAIYSITADKPAFNKFGVPWKPTFRARPGETFNRFVHRVDSAMEAFYQDKWLPNETAAAFAAAQTAPVTQAATATTPTQTNGASGGANGGGVNVATCVFMEVGESYRGNKPQLVFKTLEADDLKFTATDANGLANKLLAVNNPNTGKPFTPSQMVKDSRFELKCKIEWEPSADGRYKNVKAVKPIAA